MTGVRLRELTGRAAVTVATVAAAGSLLFGLAYRLGWQIALVNVSGLLFVATALVGAALVRGDRRNRAGWVFLIAGTAVPLSNLFIGLATATYQHGLRLPARPAFALLASGFAVLGVFLVATLGVLWFPDGRPGGWRRKLLAVVCVAELAGLMLWSELSTPFSDTTIRNPIAPGGWIGHAVSALGISIVLVAPVTALTTWALLRRASRAATPAARRGLRLAACAAAWVPVSFVICIAVSIAGLDTGTVTVIENSAGLTIGIAAWIGIRRYGLLDIRVVVSRALAYAAMTALVVAGYVGAAAVLTRLLHGRLPELVALAVAFAIVAPLRDWIQQAVNRLLYGLRDEPATAFVRLGLRLDAAGAPDEVLPAAVRTVAETLRLSYVAILADGEVLASAGTASGAGAVHVALPFGGETVGTLVVEARDGGTAPPPIARDLLDALASHVAAAVRAVSLNRSLAASREALVLAREEERRLMRRELHDGVGPTLAAIGLGLDAADRAAAGGRPEQVRETLAELRAETRGVLDTIRRIAYDLRPPILDELGLDAALREQAARFGATSATSPAELPALPAAVEVATYRIAVEAMANAARHAPGARVSVTLQVNGLVELDVVDDGAGIGAGFTAGVGITSMRERAAELGGLVLIERQQPRGTRVRVVLPLRPAALPAPGAAVSP
jgi:two-component system NarL family sensor kinase